MTWTRFWRWFKRNIDLLLTIIVSFIFAATNIFSPTPNVVPSLTLVALALIALSTIRDRQMHFKQGENISKAFEQEKNMSKAFEQQSAACRYLIDYVSEHGAKEAILLQYSCTTSFDLACVLLDQGANVTIYIQHEDVPANLGSQGQKERIKQTIRRLQSHVRSNQTKMYHLKLYKYRTLGTISAIKIDNRVLSMGCYTYEQVDPAKEKHYGTDTISISGHDRETIVAFEDSTDFKAFDKTFNIIEHEYQNNVEEVQL